MSSHRRHNHLLKGITFCLRNWRVLRWDVEQLIAIPSVKLILFNFLSRGVRLKQLRLDVIVLLAAIRGISENALSLQALEPFFVHFWPLVLIIAILTTFENTVNLLIYTLELIFGVNWILQLTVLSIKSVQ